MIEKRKATRIRIHNKNEVRLSFYTPKKVRIEGYIWDYSRFGLGVVIPAETLKLKEKETLHIFNCSIHCFGQERNLGDASIVRMYKEKGEQFLGIYLENEFVDLDFLNEKHITHIQEDEIKSVKLEFRDMEKVIPEFKALVSDISLGFSLYKRKLDDLDKKFSKEPDILQKSLFQSILKGIGREFYQFLNDTITNLKRTVKPYNKIQHEIHGYYIRKVLWHYLMESPFIWRTNIKPRGYAGDSEMMELVYRNSYEGESSFGKIFHYHPVNTKAAMAVRNRRALINRTLIEKAKNASIEEKAKILSIACGPAWEIRDFLQNTEVWKNVEINLLDQDEDALDEARKGIESVLLEDHFRVNYLRESVRTILRSKEPALQLGNYNFIYSMGLFDYLTFPVAKVLTEKLFSMLSPGGELLIGNYHEKNETRIYMEYLMDWKLIYRDEEEMLELTENLKDIKNVEIGFEESGSQMFLRVTKNE